MRGRVGNLLETRMGRAEVTTRDADCFVKFRVMRPGLATLVFKYMSRQGTGHRADDHPRNRPHGTCGASYDGA